MANATDSVRTHSFVDVTRIAGRIDGATGTRGKDEHPITDEWGGELAVERRAQTKRVKTQCYFK